MGQPCGGTRVRYSRRHVLRTFWRWTLWGTAASLFPETLVKAAARPLPVNPFNRRLRLAQISDIHLGYRGPANRDIEASLHAVLTRVQGWKPDVLLVSGDLSQGTSDAVVRADRLKRALAALHALEIPIWAVPGEQDALMDAGRVWQEVVGPLYFHRTVSGVHVIGLDNVSRGFFVDAAQLQWLEREVSALVSETPLIVLLHAPLASVYPPWNWYTYNGAAVARLLTRFPRRLVLYGHIHQLLPSSVAGLREQSCYPVSFVYPLPDPSEPSRLEPWPQSYSHPDFGLGCRLAEYDGTRFHVRDVPLMAGTTP